VSAYGGGGAGAGGPVGAVRAVVVSEDRVAVLVAEVARRRAEQAEVRAVLAERRVVGLRARQAAKLQRERVDR
jgi:hypothetical protein